MKIRLDSTSPVREVKWEDVRPKLNKPEIKNFDYQESNKNEKANFKPRSVINESLSGITKISSASQQSNNLLKKDVTNKGSYLNAESLQVRFKFYWS